MSKMVMVDVMLSTDRIDDKGEIFMVYKDTGRGRKPFLVHQDLIQQSILWNTYMEKQSLQNTFS